MKCYSLRWMIWLVSVSSLLTPGTTRAYERPPIFGELYGSELYVGSARKAPLECDRLIPLTLRGEEFTSSAELALPNRYCPGAMGRFQGWEYHARWRVRYNCIWHLATRNDMVEVPQFALFRLPLQYSSHLVDHAPPGLLMPVNSSKNLPWTSGALDEEAITKKRVSESGFGFEWVSDRVVPLQEQHLTPGFYDLWPTSDTCCLVAVSLKPRRRDTTAVLRLLPEIDQPTVVVCEYRFGAVKEDNTPRWAGVWSVVAELKADFCEPFCLLLDRDNYYIVNETGNLFAAKQGVAKTTLKLLRPADECPIRAILYDERFSAFYACAIPAYSETEATCFHICGRLTERTARSDFGKLRLENSPAASMLSVVRALKQSQVFDAPHAAAHDR